MKRILLMLCVLIAYTLSFAQTEKGKCFVAGNSSLRLDVGKEKYSYSGTTSENFKFTYINFDPMAGYFLIDRLPVGLYMDINVSNEDYTNSSLWKTRSLIAGPFVRYYLKPIKKFNPFAEARVGFGTYREGYDNSDMSKESAFSYRLGAGASYFLTDNVALDSFIGYDYDGYTVKGEGDADDYVYFYSSVEINFGIVVIFGLK